MTTQKTKSNCSKVPAIFTLFPSHERIIRQDGQLNEERVLMGAAEVAKRAFAENKSTQEILGEEKLN